MTSSATFPESVDGPWGSSGSAPVVVPLHDPRAADFGQAGVKAARLARLAAEGFPVPDGVIVLSAACARVRGDVPADVRDALARALPALGEGPFAVRSSSVGEDAPDASHAGLFVTELGASGLDGVCAAVARVVASAASARVRVYHGGRSGDAEQMAVLVQRQVPAEAAGVAFTADPVTGDTGHTLVSAVRGLGERLVSGAATPQEWVVQRGLATQRAMGAGVDVDAITAEQAADVASLADAVAARAGSPQDIEWALARGRVHLVQARPITALPVPPPGDLPPGVWIKEAGRRAEQMTPLGASLVLPMVSDVMADAFEAGGSFLERIEMRAVGGEVYLRLIAVGGPRANRGAPPPWPVLGLLARVAPPLRARSRAARRAVDPRHIDALLQRWTREWRPEMLEHTQRLASVDLTEMSDGAVRAHLDDALALTRRGLGYHFALMPPYALVVHELAKVCADLFGWELAATLDLLAGCSDATSRPSRDLAEVAALDSEAAREAAFEEWCARYGGRLIGDDVGATLADRPDLLAGLLRDAIAGGGGTANADRRREAAEQRAAAALAGKGARAHYRFESALTLARRVYPTREDSALWGACHPGGQGRRALLDIGRRLAERDEIDNETDSLWLDFETLLLAHDGATSRLRERVARAKAEYAWTAAHPGPAVRGGPPSPPPNFRGLPAPARRMNAALLWVQDHQRPPAAPDTTAANTLAGARGSAGRYTGPVRIVRGFDESARVRAGDVLVCPSTDPSWSVLFGRIGALVTDAGGVLSHAAIIAREYGIPAVIGTGSATTDLHDGETVTVDGNSGRVVLTTQHTGGHQ